ncbi:MAG: hypothetical protein ACNA8W_02585 [Bradymonadaceae bacterium]
MTLMKAWARFALISFITLGLGACSSCEDPVQCPELPCEAGQVCAQGQCLDRDQGRCEPMCGAGQVCENGRCVESAGRCTALGEVCDPRASSTDGFLCVDWGGADGAGWRCTAECADSACNAGSACFLLSWGQPTSCTSEGRCGAGELCSSGRCYTAACRASECEGQGIGDGTCSAHYGNQPGFESGAKCYDVGNASHYCFPAGTREEDQSCLGFADAYVIDDLASTCGVGLECVDEQCRRLCEQDEACHGDEACIKVPGQAGGFCGPACTAFEIGSCGEAMTCHPVSSTQGYCRPAGDGQAFARCEPGAGQCSDGLICVSYQDGGINSGRCHPICHVAASPTGEDGRVSHGAQAIRDATCPQPESAPVYATFVNLAQAVGSVDIYLNGSLVTSESLQFEDGFRPGDSSSDAHGFGELSPGNHRLAVRLGGSPSTDAPIAETTFVASAGDIVFWAVVPVVGGAFDDVEWLVIKAAGEPELQARSVAFIHAVVDLGEVDILAVEAGADLDGSAVLEFVALSPGEQTEFVVGDVDSLDIFVFTAGEEDRSEVNAALIYRDVLTSEVGERLYFMRGTMEPDDFNGTSALTAFDGRFPEHSGTGVGPTLSCVDSGGGVFGHCRQLCDGPESYGLSICEGEAMGCAPMWRTGLFEWRHSCVPVGSLEAGQSCNPQAQFGECDEGLYCLEYGNSSDHYSGDSRRGLCTSLCVEGEAAVGILECDAGQICGRWSYTDGFDVGRCGYPCSPGRDYGDEVSCPAGLQSCLPVATLEDDATAPGLAPPHVVEEPPVCAASGNIAEGQGCAGLDCQPGSECMYPRSHQLDFVPTLLSPYFGGQGLRPVCTPQCDPFGTGLANHECESGETCLFNYPWSANVGHCAPIVEESDILGSCNQPGHSCGQDAVCVDYGGQNICFRFCQYEGGTTQGGYTRSSCPNGYQCAPFVQDIGYCIDP